MPHYLVAGLKIASEVPMPVSAQVAPFTDPDVTIRLGASRPVPRSAPEGETCVDADYAAAGRVVLTRLSHGYILRYFGLAEFHLDAKAASVEAWHESGTTPEFLAIICGAGLLAIILKIRGRMVLHASAVEMAGRALAIAGLSGAGKSTVAAALCAAGARLISDDLVAPLQESQTWLIPVAATELRLRSAELPAQLGLNRARISRSADQRTVLHLQSPLQSLHPFGAIVFPRILDEPQKGALVERMAPTETLHSLFQLGRRIMGVVRQDWQATEFLAFAQLANAVPAYRWNLKRGHYGAESLRPYLSPIQSDWSAR